MAALAHVAQGNAATSSQVAAFRAKYNAVTKGNAGVRETASLSSVFWNGVSLALALFLAFSLLASLLSFCRCGPCAVLRVQLMNTVSDKSQRFSLLVRKDSGATIVANSVFSENFGFTGTKGFIGAFVELGGSGDRLVLASTHMPMNGDEKAPEWRVGLDERAGSMTKMMTFLRKQTAWVEGRTTFLLAGDTNMRVDTDGEQLRRAIAASASTEASDAKFADFAGFVEPRFPSSYTCRFQSRDKVAEANRAAYDKCREGGEGYGAVDAQGAVTPVSVCECCRAVVMSLQNVRPRAKKCYVTVLSLKLAPANSTNLPATPSCSLERAAAHHGPGRGSKEEGRARVRRLRREGHRRERGRGQAGAAARVRLRVAGPLPPFLLLRPRHHAPRQPAVQGRLSAVRERAAANQHRSQCRRCSRGRHRQAHPRSL